MRLIFAVMAAAALSGCATWQRPGASMDEFERDDTYCTTQSTVGMGRLFPRAVYAGCMQNRGWEERA